MARRFGHGLNRGEAGHAAGDERQKDEAEKHTAQKLGIGLNGTTHFEIPLN